MKDLKTASQVTSPFAILAIRVRASWILVMSVFVGAGDPENEESAWICRFLFEATTSCHGCFGTISSPMSEYGGIVLWDVKELIHISSTGGLAEKYILSAKARPISANKPEWKPRLLLICKGRLYVP